MDSADAAARYITSRRFGAKSMDLPRHVYWLAVALTLAFLVFWVAYANTQPVGWECTGAEQPPPEIDRAHGCKPISP